MHMSIVIHRIPVLERTANTKKIQMEISIKKSILLHFFVDWEKQFIPNGIEKTNADE